MEKGLNAQGFPKIDGVDRRLGGSEMGFEKPNAPSSTGETPGEVEN